MELSAFLSSSSWLLITVHRSGCSFYKWVAITMLEEKYHLFRVPQNNIHVSQIAGHFWKEEICQVAKLYPIFVSWRNKDYNRATKKLTEIQKWQKNTQKTRTASSYLGILTINWFHLLLPATTFIIILQDRAERDRCMGLTLMLVSMDPEATKPPYGWKSRLQILALWPISVRRTEEEIQGNKIMI